jgi:uncharacterized protein YjbI with pentapeptide repeats
MKKLGHWLQKDDRGILLVGLLGALIILGTVGLDLLDLYEPLDPGKSPSEPDYRIVVAPANSTLRDISWKVAELLAIPGTLVIIAYFINKRQQTDEQKRRNDAERISGIQAEERILQNYFDRMTDLLLDRVLRQSEPYSEVRNLARSRTLTTLRSVSGLRKSSVLHFLREADLINKEANIIDLSRADLTRLDLKECNLNNIKLARARLGGANLTQSALNEASLVEATLFGINLTQANVQQTDLRGANLRSARLVETDLTEANLSMVSLREADLSRANLTRADLRQANLNGANLTGAVLAEADFTEAVYDDRTHWPVGFIPETAGAIKNGI